MKKSQFTEEQILGILKQVQGGRKIADVCRVFLDERMQIIYYAHIQYPAQMIQIETDLLR